MKKSYLLILGLSFSAITFAQKKIVDRSPNETGLSVDNSVKIKGNQNSISSKTAGDVLYSETFNGTIGNWTVSDADGAVWMFDTDGPDGQYSSTSNADILTSSTAANGFMIFDADLSNTPGTAATFVDRVGSLVSPVIDMSGQTSLTIKFEHAYRTCCSASFTPKVEVSTDGFANFVTYDVTATGFGVNDFTGTVVKELNINNFLAAATNLQNFQFRFNFDGIAGATSHYFWQVDDISIIIPNDYSLVSILPIWGTTGAWLERLPYSMIPSTQVAPIDFSMLVENIGVVTQSDVVLNTNIPEGAFTNVGDLKVVVSGTIDTLNASASFTPSNSLNQYNPVFNASSSNIDVDPLDNFYVGIPFEVTNEVYARDMRVIDGSQSNTGQAYEAGNIFDLFADAQISSGSMYISSTTNVGSVVYLRLYTIDPTTGDFIFADESLPYTITATDISTMLTLNLQNTVNLTANTSYLLVGGTLGDGGATNDLRIGTSGTSAPQTSFFLDEAGTWFYTTNTPMVRMHLISPVSITSSNPSYTFCPGGSVDLTSSSATGNVWSPGGETTQSITVTTPGIYSVTANGFTSPSVNLSLQTINDAVTLTGATLFSAELNGNATYQWFNCTTSQNVGGATSQSFSPSTDGDYSVIVTLNGCSVTSSCISYIAPPVVTSSDANNILCNNETVTLTSTIVNGNIWSPGGETTQSITVSAANTYFVTNSGIVSNSITIQTPVINAATTLNGSTITATQASGASYQWIDCATSSAIIGETSQSYTPLIDGDYLVQISLSTCQSSSTCTNVILPLAISSNDVDNTICANGSVVLTSSKATGNSWSPNGETTQSITVSTAGDYSVTVNGVTSNIITVSVTAITNTVVQNGNVLSTVNTPGLGFQWVTCPAMTNVIGQSFATFTPAVDGSYALITTLDGCSSTSSCFTIAGVGLNENEAFSSFSVYPNPAADNIAIDFSLRAESAVNVSITDLSGKVVYTSNLGNKTAGASSLNINTAAFANGIYVVNVLTNNGIATEKLVIRK